MLTIILNMCEYAREELSKYLSEFTSPEVSTISTVLEIMVSFVSGGL
jgi:DNA-binding phage protein